MFLDEVPAFWALLGLKAMVAISVLQHSDVLNTFKSGNALHFLGSGSVVGKKGGGKFRKLKCDREGLRKAT